MPTPDTPRRQLLKSTLAQYPDEGAQTTICLWEQLAPELISIIGEGGFRPLFARSIRLAGKEYPWLLPHTEQLAGTVRFAGLEACLQAQDASQARQAMEALFTIFLDILASLIGEELTTHLLQLAWRKKMSKTPAKDFLK